MSSPFLFLLDKAGRPVWRAALAAALLALAGCGPGTGGTGSGTSVSALDYFGASPANVCSSGPSTALACPPAGNTGSVGAEQPGVPLVGTDGVLFTDAAAGGNTVLSLIGNRAYLNARCPDLDFEGDWGTIAGSNPRYFGQYTLGPKGAETLSTLSVQAVGGGNRSLSVTLQDREGRVVRGPWVLQRVVIPTAGSQTCPG